MTPKKKDGDKPKILRSRFGCKNCKRLKIKCNEEKPACSYCVKNDIKCDYTIKLTWGGRPYKDLSKRKKSHSSTSASENSNNNKAGSIEFVVENIKNEAHKKQSDPKKRLLLQECGPRKWSKSPPVSPYMYQYESRGGSPKEESKLLNGILQHSNSINFMNNSLDHSNSLNTINHSSSLNTSNSVDSNTLVRSNSVLDDNLDPTDLNSVDLRYDVDVHDGIESLLNVFDRISNGTHQLNLANSDLFNAFVTTPPEHKNDPEYSMDNYSEDLSRIESFLPDKQSNLLNDFVSPHFSGALRPKITLLDEDETVESEIPPPVDLLSSIPPQLSPLPELLLQIPFYKYLFHFWIDVGASNMVPAPSHIYQDNPFKVILPQMAMSCPAILTTILALSARFRSSLSDGNYNIPDTIIDQLLGRSCTELLKLLKNKEESTSDSTLATILLLSCYEVYVSENFERHRAHTLGARQIILARHSKRLISQKKEVLSPKTEATESSIALFLMRWFAYVDIIGALSSTKDSHKYLSSGWDNEFEEVDSLGIPDGVTTTDPKRDIDYLLGFDVKLLRQLADLVALIRTTDAYVSEHGNTNIPVSIVSRALEIQDNIANVYQQGEARRQKDLDKIIVDKVHLKLAEDESPTSHITTFIQQDNIMRCTNKVYSDMGYLNLYRRVLHVPRESPLIQRISNGVADMLEQYIEPCSSAEICLLFCVFSAACETLDADKRQFFLDRFTNLAHTGNICARTSILIIKRCWDTGEDWLTASRELEIDMALIF